MITVVLFDVDGVLVNGAPFSRHLARDHGISLDRTRGFFTGIFNECLVGRADLKQELPVYLEQWGWSGSVDAFLRYWFVSEHIINEPLVAAVQQLREQGIRCYIATNQESYRTAYILERMGFVQQFDGSFSSAHVGYMKHEKAFFEHVLRNLELPGQEIVFWDDSPGNIEIARQVGLHAEVYKNLPDFIDKMNMYLSPSSRLTS